MHKGLEYALEEELSMAKHRKCARHVYVNWAKKWKGAEKSKKFWECAWSTFEVKFKDKLKEMDKLGKGTVEDLITYETKDWCRAYFRTDCKCDTVDNNMSETFNGWILSARCKSIITMNEEIRVQIMNRLTKMRHFASTWITDISPVAIVKLEKNKLHAMICHVEWNSHMGFEIIDGEYGHTVDLNMRKCTCREWELNGIPCAHAICAMYHRNLDPVAYIDYWYHKKTFLLSYGQFMQPVRGMKLWPTSINHVMIPPSEVKKIGRKKMSRIKGIDEPKKFGKLSKKGTILKCSYCKQPGHNRSFQKIPLNNQLQHLYQVYRLYQVQHMNKVKLLCQLLHITQVQHLSQLTHTNQIQQLHHLHQLSVGMVTGRGRGQSFGMRSRGRGRGRGISIESGTSKKPWVCGIAPPRNGFGLHFDNYGGLNFRSGGGNFIDLQPPKRIKKFKEVNIDFGF